MIVAKTSIVHKIASGQAELRRGDRTAYRLPVTLVRGREEIPLRSEDVSFSGLFLETDEPPPLRHLVRLRLILPPYHRELSAHGVVVRVVPPGNPEGRRPGVGVELFALDRAARTVWGHFVARAAQGDFRQDDIDWSGIGEVRFLDPEIASDGDPER
jgi:hypothetical protein